VLIDMRGKVFLIGIGLTVPIVSMLALLTGAKFWPSYVPVILISYVLVYAAGGVFVGFIWPQGGWRLGLWLVGFFFITMILSIPFSDRSRSVDLKGALTTIGSDLLIVLAACGGAETGSLLKRRYLAKRRNANLPG
jgi:hypothetical protein